MAHLFVLDISYLANLDRVEEQMDAHRAFLADHYADGTFLASGRKEPRDGGVVLAQGERSAIEKTIAVDPFVTSGVAEYRITEFLPTMTAPALAEYAEPR